MHGVPGLSFSDERIAVTRPWVEIHAHVARFAFRDDTRVDPCVRGSSFHLMSAPGANWAKGETQWPTAVPLASICFTMVGARCVLMEMSTGARNMICTASGSNQKLSSCRGLFTNSGVVG